MQPFDRIAERYQSLHSGNPFQEAATAWLISSLPVNAKVLDIGCGTGVPTAKRLAEAGLDVLGVDVSERAVEIARQQVPLAVFAREDVRQHGAPDDSYEAVVAFFSLLMLPRVDIEQVLDRVAHWLTPAGLFAISMVDFDADSVPVDFLGENFPASGYDAESLKDVLTSAGLEVTHMETVMYKPQGEEPERQIFVRGRKAQRV